jgi:hypothetical protein
MTATQPTTGLDGALCVGMHWLFDSTYPSDHQIAKKICSTCPALTACRQALKHELAISATLAMHGGGPRGTWAGRLVGKPEKPYRGPVL